MLAALMLLGHTATENDAKDAFTGVLFYGMLRWSFTKRFSYARHLLLRIFGVEEKTSRTSRL